MANAAPKEIRLIFNQTAPYYKQLIAHISALVDKGKLLPGDLLPSMNVLSRELGISSETVKKAYNLLRQEGIIEAAHGIGFHIAEKKDLQRVLLLFDKISTYKQVLLQSFLSHAGAKTHPTIRLHNQDIDLFEQFVTDNLDRYDYFLITPHFAQTPEVQERVVKILKKIPNRKLILADRLVAGLPGNFGAVYQDFEADAYIGLTQCTSLLKKYRKLNLISMPGSLYAPMIRKSVKKFCHENNIELELHQAITPKLIRKNEAFFILNSQLDAELIALVRIAKEKCYEIGKDIGILSYNEAPINEIILNGLSVVSTDFVEMGRLAAEMIRSREMKKIKCRFNFIGRSSF